ncbi:MAG: hypothetical protein LBB41_06945 [Prevotellaceae bacterium]|jgi:hypothetical protein|nr:hypothetical protein [Prevotellaceae bacterium]
MEQYIRIGNFQSVDYFYFEYFLLAVLWIIYQVFFIRSIVKYKYRWWWAWWLLSLPMLFYPPLVFILQANRENKVIKKTGNVEEKAAAKLKLRFATAYFVFYFCSYMLLAYIFKNLAGEGALGVDRAMISIEVITLFLIPLYFYAKLQCKKLFAKKNE